MLVSREASLRKFLVVLLVMIGSGSRARGAETDDRNDHLSGALALGAVSRTVTATGTIDAATDVDMFAFTVRAGQRASFDIDQTSGLDSYIRLFDTNGMELAANNDNAGPGEINTLNS